MAFGCDPFPPNQFGTITLTGLTGGGAISPDANGNFNLGGSNVAVVGDSATNTLSFTAPGATGVSWVVNNNSTVQMQPNTGYLENFSGTATYTLPTTSNVGDVLYVVSSFPTPNPALIYWQIFLNAGQQIALGGEFSGIGPTDTSQNPPTSAIFAQNMGTSIYLVCSVANTRWIAISLYGNVMVK